MTATPPIVDRETSQKQIDTQRVREKAHTREGTRLPRLAGGCRWSRSTRRRRWSAPPAGSRSSTPSRSRSQQFALGPVGGWACAQGTYGRGRAGRCRPRCCAPCAVKVDQPVFGGNPRSGGPEQQVPPLVRCDRSA
jgi:hypothetical protein